MYISFIALRTEDFPFFLKAIAFATKEESLMD